jgi:hypothetical protein
LDPSVTGTSPTPVGTTGATPGLAAAAPGDEPPHPIDAAKSLVRELNPLDAAIAKQTQALIDWKPTTEKDYKLARVQAMKAAQELAAARQASVTRAGQFPWMEFGGALLSDKSTRFGHNLGAGATAAAKAQGENQGEADRMTQADVASQMGDVREQNAENRARNLEGFELTKGLAALQRTSVGRAMPIDMALAKVKFPDTSSPEYAVEVKRNTLAREFKNNPDINAALAATATSHADPDGPEFQQAREEAHDKRMVDKLTPLNTRIAANKEHQQTGFENSQKLQAQRAENAVAFYKLKQQDLSVDPKTIDSMAEQALTGDPEPLRNWSRNPTGLVQLRNRIVEMQMERGLGGKDQAAANLQNLEERANARATGTRVAGITIPTKELEYFSPLALKASADVPRTDFKPFNALYETILGQYSPEQARFQAATASVVTAYAGVISRTGGNTVYAQQRAEHILSAAYSPEMYKAAVDQLNQEAKAAEKAALSVGKERTERITGRPAAPSAKPATPVPGARGPAQDPSGTAPGSAVRGSPVPAGKVRMSKGGQFYDLPPADADKLLKNHEGWMRVSP